MALVRISFSDITDVEFTMPGSAGPVRGDAIYTGADAIAIETAAAGPGRAIFLRAGSWRRAFYNDLASLEALLLAVPTEPAPRFVALPESVWPICSKRWPSLHFHEHDLWRCPPQVRCDVAQGVEILHEGDLDQCAAMQPYAGEYGGRDYLEWLIRRQRGRGVRAARRLRAVGFVLDDNAIGFVRVADQDRRRGWGSALLQSLTIAARGAANEALGFVSVLNTASQRLVAENGWLRTEIRTAWVRERTPEEIQAYQEGRF